ncbi:MAG: DUF3237 domain-containing protein [Burkholderiaceae bacterium]
MNDPTPVTLEAPRLEHLCDLAVTVAPVIDAGDGPFGRRRVIPITGGVVSGPSMRGRVMPAGADFQIVVAGTTAHLDARYLIELDDGARIFVHNTALRHAAPEVSARMMRGEPVDPADVYFRCQPRFETGDVRWRWLGERQFIGRGERMPDSVRLSFWLVH